MSVAILGVIDSPLLGHTLRSCLEVGVPVTSVIIDSKRFDGKSLKIWNDRTAGRLPTIAISDFERNRIPVFFVRSHNSAETIDLISSLDIKLILNGGTPRILTRDIFSAPSLGVLNVHPGKLPEYRGCTAVEWAIFNGDQIFNTVHYIEEGIDTGRILAEEMVDVFFGDTYADVRVRCYQKGFHLLARNALRVLSTSQPETINPDPDAGNYYSPIPDALLAEVREKLSLDQYRHQKRKMIR